MIESLLVVNIYNCRLTLLIYQKYIQEELVFKTMRSRMQMIYSNEKKYILFLKDGTYQFPYYRIKY